MSMTRDSLAGMRRFTRARRPSDSALVLALCSETRSEYFRSARFIRNRLSPSAAPRQLSPLISFAYSLEQFLVIGWGEQLRRQYRLSIRADLHPEQPCHRSHRTACRRGGGVRLVPVGAVGHCDGERGFALLVGVVQGLVAGGEVVLPDGFLVLPAATGASGGFDGSAQGCQAGVEADWDCASPSRPAPPGLSGRPRRAGRRGCAGRLLPWPAGSGARRPPVPRRTR